MNKEKEDMLKRLINIRQTAEKYLKDNNFDNYTVKNVIHYSQKIKLVNLKTKRVEDFELYAVISENTNSDIKDIFELEYLQDKEGTVFTISDLIKEYEGFENIKDVVDKAQENKENSEEQGELKKQELNELEEEKSKEETKRRENQEEENQIKDLKISNLKGEVGLDQQINGETLRKILDLGEEYRSIAPVRAATIGITNGQEYCFVAIKNDNTCTVIGNDKLKEDRQEGKNPYNKDIQINSDGSIEKESSIAGFKIVNRPNFFLSVGFDENSSTRETTITDVIGRKGRDGELGIELEKEGDGWQDSDVRNVLREEQGIEKSDEMIKKQQDYESLGKNNDRVENIDDREENNIKDTENLSNQIIKGTNKTWRQFANECGFRGKDAIDKAARKLIEYKKNNPELSNQDLVDGVIEEETEDFRAPDLEKKIH